MSKPDVIICTNVYNRYKTIRTYMSSLFSSSYNNDIKYQLVFVLNEDQTWNSNKALEEINSFTRAASIIKTDNLGLMGYNIGLEMGRILNIPVLCCNDDIVFPNNWFNLLHTPNKANRVNEETRIIEEKTIRPETVGVIGPCYVEAGCMKHQKYEESKKGYDWVDFIVGHCQLVTTNALKKGFTYRPDICTKFGAFDIYQSMWMCANDLNTLVNREVCFDFPESKESHFHEGKENTFKPVLGDCWQVMSNNLQKYQQEHINKHGYNKWYTE